MNLLSGIGMRTCPSRAIAALAAMAILLLAAGCGSGSHPNIATPPPGGSFSNSNLNGTYVFSYTGTDALSGGSFLAIAGTFSANGNGGISGGMIDFDDSAGALPGQTISGGSYNITADGRGRGTLNTSTPFGAITIDFVLSSNSRGSIIQFDGNGSGSGAIDLQVSGVNQSALQGSYAFSFSGVDSASQPLGTVGAFTLDASGNVTAGLQDFNENGNSFNNLQPFSITAGSVPVGSPGAAQLTSNLGGFGTLSFDVWVIDATHLKFIETDSTAFLAGDAFVSTGNTAFPSGAMVFTMSGLDTNGVPFATGGLWTSGSGQITNGIQDLNDESTVPPALNFSGGFTSVGGRPQLTLNSIYNGQIVNNTLVTSSPVFAAYPYKGGVELLEIDGGGITSGVAYVQSATSFNASQGSALNLSGVNFSTGNVIESDMIAEFSGSGLSGLYDANNLGIGIVSAFRLGNGSNSPGSNGRGTFSFPSLQTGGNAELGALNFTFYVIDSSTAVFLETDSAQTALGSLELQSVTQAPVGALARVSVVRSKSSGKAVPRKLNR
jgi:hypothetical protein